ncbi:MAG: phage tail tape measure protein [Anaerovoracaceae bacterium]
MRPRPGEGLKYMAMAGWETSQMLDGLEGVMMLAAASGEDLGRVSDIVTDALTAFGLEAKQAGEFADLLASASSNSNTNVSLLGESFKHVAPLFGSLGYSAEDAALALGLRPMRGLKGRKQALP